MSSFYIELTKEQILNEKWKIFSVNGQSYKISNYGRLRNMIGKSRILKCYNTEYPHYKVGSISTKIDHIRAAVLVAENFIPNKDPNKNYVIHKDGNRLNIHYKNLEWTERTKNIRGESKRNFDKKVLKSMSNTRNERLKDPIVEVLKYDILYSDILGSYRSLQEAVKQNNLNEGAATSISRVARNPDKQLTAYNYGWRYITKSMLEQDKDH